MGRPRLRKNGDLPENVYERVRTRNGKRRTYYYYRDPFLRKEKPLGPDRSVAILVGGERNSKNALQVRAMRAGAYLQNGVPIIKSGNVDEFGMFSAQTIIAGARVAERICGVYFLVDAGKIVYVGQSQDVIMRLSSHIRHGVKRFNSFAVIEAKPDELNDLEAKYIAKFTPSFNVRKPRFKPLLGDQSASRTRLRALAEAATKGAV